MPDDPAQLPLPLGHYNVVYADPPWNWRTWSDKGRSRSPDGIRADGSLNHYPVMDLTQIMALPVSALASRNSALFLWATWPMLEHAFGVIRAWGFEYSGLAWEWIKHNPETNKFAFGTGYGTRKNLEPCLLGRRGNPPIMSMSERDFIFAPRREHSRKPQAARARIQRMFEGPYLELFARERAPGWDCAFSPEADKFPPDNESPGASPHGPHS